jgi:hypothetical protein
MAVRVDRRSFIGLPAVIFSVFPTLVCPACWPAYTGVLSALGLPFIPSGAYLFPATVVFLSVAVVALAHGGLRWRRSGPLLLGAAGSAAVVAGRFVFASQLFAYVGAGMLLFASVWNGVPRRAPAPVLCGNCASTLDTKKESEISL